MQKDDRNSRTKPTFKWLISNVQTRNEVQNDSKTLPRLIPYLDESFGRLIRRLQALFEHATCDFLSASAILRVTQFREKLGQGPSQALKTLRGRVKSQSNE